MRYDEEVEQGSYILYVAGYAGPNRSSNIVVHLRHQWLMVEAKSLEVALPQLHTIHSRLLGSCQPEACTGQADRQDNPPCLHRGAREKATPIP